MMSKIKFNKEWYHDSRIAINFRTEEEADKFIIELVKVGITNWFDGRPLLGFNKFSLYGGETCYNYDSSTTLYCASKSDYLSVDYTIIKFSDLEFEDGIDKNTPEITKTDNGQWGYEPLVEVKESNKRTILRESVELKNGDIIGVDDLGTETVGLITEDYVIYNTGLHSSLKDMWYTIDNILLWYIPREELKDKAFEVSRTLFKGEINKLKDLIIHVQDKPKEIKTKTVEVFSVKFCKTDLVLSHFISDSEEICVKDIVSPIRGEHEDLYGEVINIQCKELSEEELKSYNKIIKIK